MLCGQEDEITHLIRIRLIIVMPMKSYKKLCTEFYDLDKPAAPKEALAFLQKHLESVNGPVLEPMSGSGRFLIPLLQCGVEVEGLDPSPQMLQACRAHCARQNITPVLLEGFLETIELSQCYDLIFILSGSFGLIIDEQSISDSLDFLCAHLTLRGKLIIEIETPMGKAGGLQEWNSRSVNRLDGAQVICRSQGNYALDEKINHVACEYQLVREGQIVESESEELSIRYYELLEFHGLLNNAGFSDILCFRPYGDTKADEEDEEAVFVCRKA